MSNHDDVIQKLKDYYGPSYLVLPVSMAMAFFTARIRKASVVAFKYNGVAAEHFRNAKKSKRLIERHPDITYVVTTYGCKTIDFA